MLLSLVLLRRERAGGSANRGVLKLKTGRIRLAAYRLQDREIAFRQAIDHFAGFVPDANIDHDQVGFGVKGNAVLSVDAAGTDLRGREQQKGNQNKRRISK